MSTMDQDDHSGPSTTLLCMGFSDVTEIKRALRISKGDINEAVAILTNERTVDDDVEMKDSQTQAPVDKGHLSTQSEFVDTEFSNFSDKVFAEMWDQGEKSSDERASQCHEFPATNLYELETRVYTDQWSIPYKREESLGKCLTSAIQFANEGLCEADENCRRFVEHCMPEAFKKLLTSGAVRQWGLEVQEGVFSMLQLLIDLISARLKHDPVPERLLSVVLAMAFDPDSEFHQKNRHRTSSSGHWIDVFGSGQSYAVSKGTLDAYGWLVDLINRFAQDDGFIQISKKFENNNLVASEMAALLMPLARCAEFLNSSVVCPLLSTCMQRAVDFIKNLTDGDLKSKTITSVSELLQAMKLLCLQLWPDEVFNMDSLRLEVILRMLKCHHFNARMNGLKEVTRLIDDSCSVRTVRVAINSEELLDWLADNKVLSIALEGNIDQVQYSEKIQGIMEFLGPRLSLDELTKIWNMQGGQNAQIIDNIHAIMAAASAKFNHEQFHHLLRLAQQSWQHGNDQMKKQLTAFIGRLGKETTQGKTSTKVLDLLWDLAHSPSLPVSLVEQALHELFTILAEVSHKDQTKKNYILRCIEDIKKTIFILPSLKLLHNISRSITNSGCYKSEKTALHDLNRTHDVVKMITSSLSRCHKQAVSSAGENNLTPGTLIENRYTHEEYLVEHLNFLQFLLQEGAQYLPWSRAKEIWDTLVSNPDACDKDREICFDWFSKCLQDLEIDTQSQLFQQKLLKMDPSQVTCKGFTCFMTYFEKVNTSEHKLRRSGSATIVEKSDLTGIDFLWQVALASPYEDIANLSIMNILDASYHCLAVKLKKDPVSLHKKFIGECYRRLDAVAGTVGGTAMLTAVSNATKTLTAMSVAEVASFPPPTRTSRLQNICRLLQIAERYISSIEELHVSSRTILPHGSSFIGYPILLTLNIDSTKDTTIMCHSNETLGSLRHRIAQYLYHSPEEIQLHFGDSELLTSRDQKLLGQLGIDSNPLITVKVPSSSIVSVINKNEVFASSSLSTGQDPPLTFCSSATASAGSSIRLSFQLEQEKMLPGVVMSTGGQVFDMLYQLSMLEDSKICAQIRNLLHLIPTDPAILDALDSISAKQKTSELPSPSNETGRSSPRSSPKKLLQSSQKEKAEGPRDILKNLFDINIQTSPFKLLYNLEVLSGKLIPVMQDAATIQSAQMFCEDFLNAGGLKYVLGVFQRDSMPPEVDYDIRQSCYLTALIIARYLLCGQTGLEYGTIPLILGPHCIVTKRSLPDFSAHASVTVGTVALGSLPVVSTRAIQMLNIGELMETLGCIMRVSWAAAAGQLHLASGPLPSSCHSSGRRSRQSSTGSNASSGSEGEGQGLHSGVCGQQEFVSNKDSLLAQKSLEFLVTCLQLRMDVFNSFSTMPCVPDFIVDMLLRSPSEEVRKACLEQFFKLSTLKFPGNTVSTRDFLLQKLLKARLPLWVPTSSTRGANQRLLSQCKEYFEFVCRLLKDLTVAEQQALHIDAKQMFEDEIAWLQGFSVSSNSELHAADNTLLAGHFNLIKTLLTCEGVRKIEDGKTLAVDLLNHFLFPASHLMSQGTVNANITLTPRCSSHESRVAAYEVLVELARGSLKNMEQIVNHLVKTHHLLKPELVKEYEYEPLVAGRASCGYVGLKNAGATCYMNSVIQQLYMQPGVREAILSVDEGNIDEESLFYQFQLMFGHLLESQLQYHVPEKFWKCFRLWGQPINVREQQDSFEFFTHLIDQLDEYLNKNGWEPVFKSKYEGTFSDQKICQGCPHRFEREETFMALNLPIKSHSLLDSLDQFVKGELLEGDNAYFCEKCGEKRNTIKRTCIKTLPPALVIQLKRFGYDWEANRAMKFDDYFKFPWLLEMSPYTADGIQDEEILKGQSDDNREVMKSNTNRPNSFLYELVGIVVHSGQANAGHYYSYIKERRSDNTANVGRWFKFNDTTVEEYDLNDITLEAECFGGTYKAKVRDSGNSYPEIRQRYWNGYMLFYDRMEEAVRTPRTPRKIPGRYSFRKTDRDNMETPVRTPRKSQQSGAHKHRDSLSQLTQLVDRGERQGLFLDKMPARIQQVVREENLVFMHNRDVYSDTYFNFVLQLAICNVNSRDLPKYPKLMIQSLQLGVNFLFNTYLRYRRKVSSIMNEWVDCFETIVSSNKEAAFWLLNYLANDSGSSYVKPLLLECPNKDVRLVFQKILEKSIANYFFYGGKTSDLGLDHLISRLIGMLNQEVPDNCRSCSQYFLLLAKYVQMGVKACAHVFEKNGFYTLLVFLLGPAAANMQSEESFPRRWSSVQTREFGALHVTLASLVLSCDLSRHRTCDPEKYTIQASQWSPGTECLDLPDEVCSALFGPGAVRFVREIVSAYREISGPIDAIVDMLVQCSFCNANFSVTVINQVMLQYSSVPSNELKNLSHLLLEILSLEDPLQFIRIQHVIDGFTDENGTPYDGMLAIIRTNQTNDSRRSYQGVKFLVTLAHKCSLAKDYLMQTPNKWQWAVNWLKKMMSEHTYWGPQSNIPVSNEDSNTKTFQRTVSAQDTLADATALLTELESPENQDLVMDMDDDPKSEILCMKFDKEEKVSTVTTKLQTDDDGNGKLKRVQGMDDLDCIDP